ncbi:MAG: DNA repair protein RecN [Clostridiales bacterium]|nr:DNA repair protein RecN [Clostridiales bacterium]
MLERIVIKNLALISSLEIDFCGNLNVFTGETGAGKSIIVDSLMLLIGARYDKSMLKYGEEKGYVEGVFSASETKPLEEMGIDAEDGTFIVTRKFDKNGKNDIRINGKLFTTAMLRELMAHYVDIYGQNEYQSLLKVSEQRKILDYYVFKNDGEALNIQRELYNEYNSTVKQMGKLGDERARAQRIDILRYQIDEINSAKIEDGEEERLVERRHVLMASERIKNALADCINSLDSDDGAGSAVGDAVRSLASVSDFSDTYSSLYERLRSVEIELDDITECVKDEIDKMDSSERELDEVVSRLDKIRALKNKYGAYSQMVKFLHDAEEELKLLENGADEYDRLCKKAVELENKLFKNCVLLSDMRRLGAKKMGERIVSELNDLGMAGSKFEAVFNDKPSRDDFTAKLTATGFDEIEFYLSPNAGQPLLPLAKIISGGEMSRFMLSIKLITGDLGNIDTMIFDEIDTGISGAVGLEVAKKLCKLSRGRQVLCVTHLPQIAAMADAQYYIEKKESGGNTSTSVSSLDRAGQIGELSRLSGTKGVSTSSDKNAAEMKDWADAYKKGLSA